MEILKTLLANTFDKRIRRLENRTISQMNDLKFTKDCFANQGKMIDRLATIKFTKPKPKEHLKRDVSAGTLTSRTHRLRDNTPVTTHKEPNRQKTPVNVEKKNVARTGRSKSPIPSYMADTALKQIKKKKKIENIYTQIKRNKEKENGIENVSTTVTHKKVTRPLTPDGRTLQRRNRKKPIEKNTNNNNTHNDENMRTVIRKNKEKEEEKHIENEFKLNEIETPIKEEHEIISQIKIEEMKPIEHKIVEPEVVIVPKVEPEKQDINIGEYLLNQKNKVSLFSIASYLSLDTKLNLFSISKQFKPYLANEIDNLKHNFEDANSITLSSKIIDKKADLKIRFRDEELHGATIPFTPSRGAVKAVELLNEELYNRIYRQNELKEPLNKIIFIYRIYMQLLGKNDITSIKNDNLFWKEFTKFILDNNNGKTGNFYNESVKDFVFTSENIYKIRRIVGNKVDEIKPTNYSKICGTTGLVIFLIKDALEYCGIMQNDKKNSPSLLMKNLEYLEHIENKISSYIAFLNK